MTDETPTDDGTLEPSQEQRLADRLAREYDCRGIDELEKEDPERAQEHRDAAAALLPWIQECPREERQAAFFRGYDKGRERQKARTAADGRGGPVGDVFDVVGDVGAGFDLGLACVAEGVGDGLDGGHDGGGGFDEAEGSDLVGVELRRNGHSFGQVVGHFGGQVDGGTDVEGAVGGGELVAGVESAVDDEVGGEPEGVVDGPHGVSPGVVSPGRAERWSCAAGEMVGSGRGLLGL
ncbi:hypothetical protein [Streptomyces scabiei]|uniref:hypothetical protein n=1 Tax=Streptomyces scabiei TaxID=1930 RepID=UPI00131EC0A8|nr:hypothetical protein [Streptomyces scabiei]